MPWVQFTGHFDWDPPERKGRVTLSFEAGQVRNVRRECADAAIAAGKAQPTRNPDRPAKTEPEDVGG